MPLWLYFAIALVAAGIPSRWLWDGRMLFVNGTQLRTRLVMVNPADNRRRRRWWKSKSLWLDPLRGGAAGWCLMTGEWQWLEGFDILIAKFIYYLLLLLPLLMVLWQTFGRGKQNECIVPVLFAVGLLAGYYHPVGGGFGWVLGLSALGVGALVLMALQSIRVMLFSMAVVLMVIGYFLVGLGIEWLLLPAIFLVPFARALVRSEKLVLAFRG
jgi:hypothetical protein